MRGLGRFGWVLGAAVCLVAAACGGTTKENDGTGGQPSGGTGGAGGSSATGGGGTGGGSTGGAGGTGGVPGISQTDKIDLLLVIDNSYSMEDKQELMAATVPRLVQRLATPRCLDGAGNPTGSNAPCPSGTSPEFPAIKDFHVGVVSSSLGGHGGNVCSDDPHFNDRGHLLPDMRPGLPHAGSGFLSWKAGDDIGQLVGDLAQHVSAAGEQGCGYEAPLESWFRFLVDPNPPQSVIMDGGSTVRVGTDAAVLAQRAAFLRPDSLLTIVTLSDENDCSIRDSDVGWYVSTISSGSGAFPLAKPTSACATDPNSACCRSCADTSPPEPGCPAPDPGCDGNLDPVTQDQVNLRCWQQKRRFGLDFLYPVERYVHALTRKQLCPSNPDLDIAECEGPLVDNPIYTDLGGTGAATRSSELVLYMSIVGVPWQDLATESSLADPTQLEYLSAAELASQGRWDWITGDFTNPPADPLMIESEVPRTGTSPATGQPLAPPSSASGANAANGHEWAPASESVQGDLQFSCIYPLAVPRDCESAVGGACNCKGVDAAVSAGTYASHSPLCQAPGSAPGTGYSSTQHFAKAYPGLRHMALSRAIGDQAVVTSICPKIVDPSNLAYAYNPGVEALIRAVRPRLTE